MKGLRENPKTHRRRQQYVITRGKEGWEEAEEGKGGINEHGKRLALGW